MSLKRILAVTVIATLVRLCIPQFSNAACEVPLPGDPEAEDGACGSVNPPPSGSGGGGGSGSPGKIVAWAGGYDINPFDGSLRGGIYVARISGSARRKIATFTYLNRDFGLHGLNLPDDHPSFSPDSRRIVFASNRANRDDWDIYVMNVNGTGVTPLSSAPGLDTEPVFSPDGTKIAFATERFNGTLDIAVMNADGSNVTRLTSSSLEDIEPAWRPDGQEIVFSRIFSLFNKEICVIKPNGTGFRRVTFENGEDHDATYSPDGTRIAITSERKFFPSPPYGNVHIIRVSDGKDLGDLTEDLAFGAGDPFWSKDGTLIAFFTSLFPIITGPQRLFVMSANGAGKFHIPGENTVNVHPAIGIAVDDDNDGTPNYLESGSVGRAKIRGRRVHAGETAILRFKWKHPNAWQELDTISIRFSEGRQLLGAIRHIIEDESFSVFDGETEEYSDSMLIGEGVIESPLLTLDLDQTRIVNVSRRTIRLDLAVRFSPEVAGKKLRIRVQADDINGNSQDEEKKALMVK